MGIELRPLRDEDAVEHCLGEDALTVRWLTGGYGTIEGTAAYFRDLRKSGGPKRGFGVWLDDRLAGYVDCDPSNTDGLAPEEVHLTYAVHPWARGRGVAVEAVRLISEVVRRECLGERVALRIDPDNAASQRVAQRAGFSHVRDFVSSTDSHPDGTPATLQLWLRDA
ncbi:GNAT family N-acetyltransferase [Calidifontibacter sp. DB0510]|uniref:GNAT family N-acetyltransferase n=1 Tax=Metallococcus carri TaxID=1656884 RepID=A0A967B8B2_9MICO|nr:GNAT family N-acetyltransferase [Metallococcus carri]NHN57432.1 GNAT family N-acetyltransferase [Metallococcus carri]NOP39172.1 GNAT family N-acetyltransferase [Calidifontibacter sp. DB2511S]